MKLWNKFTKSRYVNPLEKKQSFLIEELQLSRTQQKGKIILQHGFITLKIKGSEYYINIKNIQSLVFSKKSFELLITLESKRDILMRTENRLEITEAIFKTLKHLGRENLEFYFMDNLNLNEFVSDHHGSSEKPLI